MNKIFSFAFIFILFLTVAKSAHAISVSISNYPQDISQDPFTFTVSVDGAQTGTNYLRVDLYKEGKISYFGETYNNSDWYNGSDGKQYFPINIQSGQVWSGQVQARVENPPSSKYSGPGSYKMRIRRYTSSGSQGGEDANSSSISVNINISQPSLSPSPSPAPSPSQTTTTTSTKTTAKSPSPSPKPSPQVTTQTTKSPSPSPKSTPKVFAEKDYQPSTPSASQETPSPSPSPIAENPPSKFKVAGLLSGTGLALIGVSFVLYLWYSKRLSKNEPKDDEKIF